MKVFFVYAYTPYEGEERIAIFSRHPTKEELAAYKKAYSHKEYIEVEEFDVIE